MSYRPGRLAAMDSNYYRRRAILRRRNPEQDAMNAAAVDRLVERVTEALVGNPVIQQITAQGWTGPAGRSCAPSPESCPARTPGPT